MANNLAYIDYEKCTLCRKCVEVCPTNAIHEINFKPRKPKPQKDEKKPAPKKAVTVEEKVDLAAMAKKREEEKPVTGQKPESGDKNDNNNK
jgi:ferredoxin